MKKDKKKEYGLYEIFGKIFRPKSAIETFYYKVESIENRMFELESKNDKTASDIREYGRLSITADLLRDVVNNMN